MRQIESCDIPRKVEQCNSGHPQLFSKVAPSAPVLLVKQANPVYNELKSPAIISPETQP